MIMWVSTSLWLRVHQLLSLSWRCNKKELSTDKVTRNRYIGSVCYRDTDFHIDEWRSSLDGGDLRFWEIYGLRGPGSRGEVHDTRTRGEVLDRGPRGEVLDAWRLRIHVNIPLRQVILWSRWEFHSGGYSADDTYINVIEGVLEAMTGLSYPRLLWSSSTAPMPAHPSDFVFHSIPIVPIKVRDGPSTLQWVIDRNRDVYLEEA